MSLVCSDINECQGIDERMKKILYNTRKLNEKLNISWIIYFFSEIFKTLQEWDLLIFMSLIFTSFEDDEDNDCDVETTTCRNIPSGGGFACDCKDG